MNQKYRNIICHTFCDFRLAFPCHTDNLMTAASNKKEWKFFFSSSSKKHFIYLLTDRPLMGNWFTILLSLMSTASVMKTASWFYTPTMEAVEIRPLTNLRDRKGPNLLLRPQNQPNIYQIQGPNLMSRIGKISDKVFLHLFSMSKLFVYM